MIQGPLSIFYFLILILSIIVHEVAHGLMAEHEGDSTARVLGRITLNPLKHLDWIGSVVLPLILIISQAHFLVGWAKPVPYNPDNLKNGNKSVAKVAIAGITVNLLIAIFFGLLIRLSLAVGLTSRAFIDIASVTVLLNIILALFNAIPLAPLDGFRFLSALTPARFGHFWLSVERYSLPLLLLFLFFGWKVIAPFGFTLYTLLTGIAI